MADDATRDRVRALVRDVLSKAAPAEFEASTPAQPASGAPVKTPAAPAITRDESAKLVITEDDVRGLERGSVLRIAEPRRLTPLAANIITLGSKTISSSEMRDIVRAWLGTELTEDRHRKRVGKIDAVERQYSR